jgi:c-di-GMP-binding flagellar brake protein YcgR
MFKNAVALLRRLLVGSTPTQPSDPPSSAEERRVRVRYPANLATALQRVNGKETPRVPAKVRDISRGGIGLLVSEHIEPGTLLTVELPGPSGQTAYTVMACVVHARRQPRGDWAIGCTFSQDLDDQELASFGAKRQKPPTPSDLRKWARFPCQLRASCQVTSGAYMQRWSAEVLDISPNGMGLLVNRSVEAGTLLNIDLEGGTGQGITTILACVVHITPRDGQYALGCNFIRELSEEELKVLV